MLKSKIADTLKIMSENPYSSKLKSHKLHGDLSHLLSASIDYEYRIIFSIKKIAEKPYIILIDLGTHEEVY